MNRTITVYLVYLPVALGMTVRVARALHKSGRVFLLQGSPKKSGGPVGRGLHSAPRLSLVSAAASLLRVIVSRSWPLRFRLN